MVNEGYITWRYWLRHVQEIDSQRAKAGRVQHDAASRNLDGVGDPTGADEAARDRRPRVLPCRVQLNCRGAEWFIYNRSPAYDAILQSMRNEMAEFPHLRRKKAEAYSCTGSSNNTAFPAANRTEEYAGEEKDDGDSSTTSAINSQLGGTDAVTTLSSFLNLLPIGVQCHKGAVVMGNRNTRSILTAKYTSVTGRIDAQQSHSVDLYKQMIELDFEHPVIDFKLNRDYTDSQVHEGAAALCGNATGLKESPSSLEHSEQFKRALQIWSFVRGMMPRPKGSVESLTRPHTNSGGGTNGFPNSAGIYGQNRWLGLTRYLDEDDDFIEQERWKAVEYGQYSTIVDSPSIGMSFYWDVPGLVPDLTEISYKPLPESEININGDTPPDWGVDLKIRGGTINYGPWADRQRTELQAVFFPSIYKDASPASDLKAGATRISTVLKVVIEIEQVTTLRVPTREDSKDWRWKGRKMDSGSGMAKKKKGKARNKSKKEKNLNEPRGARSFGWVEAKVSTDSTISLTMDLVTMENGYRNNITLNLQGIEMTSSVNHGLLWRSQSQSISCDLSNPLGWSTLRKWHVYVQDNNSEFFILRDHIFLLTDLINDWTSAPPGDFHTFVPFQYTISLHFSDFRLYLNANDCNIINDPSDLDDNTLIVVWGQILQAELVIPASPFRSSKGDVTFNVEAHDGGFKLVTPPRNTQHTYLNQSDVASLKTLNINGSYSYFTTTSPTLTDILVINVHGLSPIIDLYGFLIHYFLKIKDNYFGDDIHFRTLEEYQDQVKAIAGQDSADLAVVQHSRLSNNLDVILGITAESSCALLPAHLYSSDENVRLEILSIIADLRITNYYMDLTVSSSPIIISHKSHNEAQDHGSDPYSNTQIFIDRLDLFGHRLFGLPPSEPTYLCNWDFDIGSMSGECSLDFLRCFVAALKCFKFSFEDAENAMPLLNPTVVHDVTFLRARICPINLGLRVGGAAIILETAEVKLEYTDWADSLFSNRLYVSLPDLIVEVVEAHGASANRKSFRDKTCTHGYMNISFDLAKVKQKRAFASERELQQAHIALHDSRTQRAPWLLHKRNQAIGGEVLYRSTKPRLPAMPYPSMPEPIAAPDCPVIDDVDKEQCGILPSSSRPPFDRKASFLTHSSCSKSRRKYHGDTSSRKPGAQRSGANTYQDLRSTEDQREESLPPPQTKAYMTALRPSYEDACIVVVSRKQDTSDRVGLAFTSPYRRPYFPLLSTKPDTSELPIPPVKSLLDTITGHPSIPENTNSQPLDEGTEQASLIVNVDQGVGAFCSPESLFVMTQLLAGVQSNDSSTILDELQVTSLTDVLDLEENRGKGRHIMDLRCSTPWAGLRFIFSDTDGRESVSTRKYYDLNLEHSIITAKISDQSIGEAPQPGSSKSSFHVLLTRMTCTASDTTQGSDEERAAISLSITDPEFWGYYGGEAAADLQFSDFKVTSASRKVDHIPSLLRQPMLLSEDLAKLVSEVQSARRGRLRLLILLLTIEGKTVPDPPFFTRASHVLRGASHHLRTSDSWKVMSRLRFIYQYLPSQDRDRINAQYDNIGASCPEDAGIRVIASFENWRTWDLINVKASSLVQRVYGQLLSSPKQNGSSTIVKVNLKVQKIQILVDPGPQQNEFAMENITLGLKLNAAFTTSSDVDYTVGSSFQSSARTTVVLQMHCTRVAIRLHWSLLDLVQNIFETVRAISNSGQSYENEATLVLPTKASLHLVFSCERIILTFDSRNVEIVSLCQGLRTSYLHLPDITGSENIVTGIVLHAEVATAEINCDTRALTFYKLWRPQFVVSKTGSRDDTVAKPWDFVGSGRDSNFQTLADPLVLMNAIEKFLQHEVIELKTVAESLRIAAASAQPPKSPNEQDTYLIATVALLLHSYTVSLTVLPSLLYQIYGTGARISIGQEIRSHQKLIVDFDLKANSHLLQTSESDTSIELSRISIPPINGRLGFALASGRKYLVSNTLVENMVFDASAIHAILAVVNKPEIIGLGKNMYHGVCAIKIQSTQTFHLKDTSEDSWSSQPIAYDAYATFSGLTVLASIPESVSAIQKAQFQFQIGRVHLVGSNRDPEHEALLSLSGIEIQFLSVKLDLMVIDNDDLRPCGNVAFRTIIRTSSMRNDFGDLVRDYRIRSDSLQINMFTETASVVVAILGHLQETLKTFDMSQEVKKLRMVKDQIPRNRSSAFKLVDDSVSSRTSGVALFGAMYSLELTNVCLTWSIETSVPIIPGREAENLILSVAKIDLATRKDNAARLLIENFQIQMVPASKLSTVRSPNSALLPEVVFNVAYISTAHDRRLAFQAAGKSLDLRLKSQFILPANDIRHSIAHAIQQVRTVTADWVATASVTDGPSQSLLGNKRMGSLLIDADFAGAVVHIQGRDIADTQASASATFQPSRSPHHGRYNQFTPENANNSSTTLRAPGIAFKVEYKNKTADEKSLNAEMKVDASSNILYPTVVPLIMELSSSIKNIVGEQEEQRQPLRSSISQSRFLGDDRLRGADPSAVLGNCALNLGLRICRQEFSLSCQPIARVAATAQFDDIYLAVNTVQSQEHGRFFTISGAFTELQASVQHVYSRESTGNLEVKSLIVSLMNSKHVSAGDGISVIVNISPMKAQINAKQAQDFLLFREIWVPPEIRHSSSMPTAVPTPESQSFIGQRYQQIAAASAFPWNVTISIAALDYSLDLGQSLGKSAFEVSKFWVTSKKTSTWEQNLCLGFDRMAVTASGRMSGFVALQEMKVRTSIQWPFRVLAKDQAPLVQASLAFSHLRIKAAFDYQAFLIADITNFEFMMYNVRDPLYVDRDRLVGVLNGDKVQVFCTTTSASQAVALYQTFERLHQEKIAAYETSLRDIEKFLRRKSSISHIAIRAAYKKHEVTKTDLKVSSLKLQTDVVVSIKAVNLGAFPSTFVDNQIFKLEALDASARFAVMLNQNKIHSTLGMTLGQLRIALAGITRVTVPTTLDEILVEDIVNTATSSRGGTILKVPKLVATMETWQIPESIDIDYVFKSSFQGKVDVGWNYSRISYIRGMWTSHARALAQHLGKPLPPSAVQITSGLQSEGERSDQDNRDGEQQKITAVVTVPQSRYRYTAREPAIIETPQLRDMGEATPPLEWIGLHRERLPNLTHQIVIVTLLEVAKEVDDAYSRILGS